MVYEQNSNRLVEISELKIENDEGLGRYDVILPLKMSSVSLRESDKKVLDMYLQLFKV